MQFASALLEYLIGGIFATFWIYGFACHHLEPDIYEALATFKWEPIKEILTFGYLAFAYTAGVIVDVLASKFTFLHKIISKRCAKLANPSYDKTIRLLVEDRISLVRTMEIYVSRARIARGLVLNSFIAAIVFDSSMALGTSISLGCLWIFLISSISFIRLDSLSIIFKNKAIETLNRQR